MGGPDSILLLVIGCAIGAVAARFWITLRQGTAQLPKPADPTGASGPVVPAVAAMPAGDEASSVTSVRDRLAALARSHGDLNLACYQSISHAGEIRTLPEFKSLVAGFSRPDVPLDALVDYALGATVFPSCAALVALEGRSDGAEPAAIIAAAVGNGISGWNLDFALDYLAEKGDLPAGAPFTACQDYWADSPAMVRTVQLYCDRLAARGGPFRAGDALARLSDHQRGTVRKLLMRLTGPVAEAIAAEIAGKDEHVPAAIDDPPEFLASLGRFWSGDEARQLDRPSNWGDALAAAERVPSRSPVRSLIVTGEPLVGKTSFLRLVAQGLEAERWRVFEASAADLMAGQQYIGQLEQRIREAIGELAVDKRIIWYIPDLLSMALSGTHQGQSASILDQLLPSLASGRIMVWTEATPAGAARLLEVRPALRRLLEVVRLEPLEDAAAMPLAVALARRLDRGASAEDARAFAAAAIEVAGDYLNATALPGAALQLMKTTALRTEGADASHRLGRSDVLETIAQMTGLPRSILDGGERLDLAAVETFLASRVIGQPEAVTSVVQRIAMLKAGLNDPGEPIGVFLFAGPTGTGKTELAKAIAEYLFGSEERMIRLDMSELQAPDSTVKLVGGPQLPPDADTLIRRIRKQPFSLVLLDEFEKSHPLVWDLFLQVFDEGRLSDPNGLVADFRHCLIILTTNLGATAHRGKGLGFAPAMSVYTSEQINQAIGQTFRPEFQNRLDRIIVFQPLTRDLMRGILKKELHRLSDRRGLKDRSWAIEWEPTAIEFLLEKGFSPEMGARPLKRAIDDHVVAPLASAIVERRFPEGEQFVFMRSDGLAVQAEFVDPDADLDAASAAPAASRLPTTTTQSPAAEMPRDVSLPRLMLVPAADDAAVRGLIAAAHARGDEVAAPAWAAKKGNLAAAMQDAAFWSRPERFETLTVLALMDRLEVAVETAGSLAGRLASRQRMQPLVRREIVNRLAQQLWLVDHGMRDLVERAPVEMVLAVEPVLESGARPSPAGSAWCVILLAMYRAWGRRRNMQLAELQLPGAGPGGQPVLLVAGFGAGRILAVESGLHVMEQPEAEGPSRIAARVVVVPAPAGDAPAARQRHAVAAALAQADRSGALIRRYRRLPAPLVRDGTGGWRSGRLDDVLAGNFDVLPLAEAE